MGGVSSLLVRSAILERPSVHELSGPGCVFPAHSSSFPAPRPSAPLLCFTPTSPGIQTTVVFWPAKLKTSGRVVMFRFEFWDCGESALRKFDHMLPVSGWVGLGGPGVAGRQRGG